MNRSREMIEGMAAASVPDKSSTPLVAELARFCEGIGLEWRPFLLPRSYLVSGCPTWKRVMSRATCTTLGSRT